ncbi:MAG: TolC family protein, partial [candidate division Zixibacteria bacterium]|nr:TolC family protein [candidate division Zixibacteria bacterium]
MKKNIFQCGLLICLSLLPLIPQKGLAEKLSLDSLIAEALRSNSDLKSAEYRYKAFEAKVPQSGALPNPMFQVTVSNLSTDSWSLGKAPMSGTELMLSQTIPFPGKQGLARKATLNLARKTKEDYQSVQNFILSQLKQNYYQLYLLHKSIGITRENKKLLENFTSIAQTRYSVGKGLQQDVLKAQVEVSKMIDELISLEEMKKTTQARINILLNRNPQEELAEPEDLFFRQMDYTEEELQTLALQYNSTIKGMGYSVNAS